MKSDFTPTDSTQDWFCYDSYITSGRPKMEAELFDYAKKMILYRLIAEGDFKQVIKQLKLRQDVLAEQSPRWKRVNFHYSKGRNGLYWLYIGDSYFCLRKVLGDF